MRIDQNSAGLQALRQQTRQTDETAEAPNGDRGTVGSNAPSRPATVDVTASALSKVAANNAAAAASRITDASLAQQLATATAAQFLEQGPHALATQAHLDPATVNALLQS